MFNSCSGFIGKNMKIPIAINTNGLEALSHQFCQGDQGKHSTLS